MLTRNAVLCTVDAPTIIPPLAPGTLGTKKKELFQAIHQAEGVREIELQSNQRLLVQQFNLFKNDTTLLREEYPLLNFLRNQSPEETRKVRKHLEMNANSDEEVISKKFDIWFTRGSLLFFNDYYVFLFS